MLVRELKLKLNKQQEQQFNEWLFHLTGAYNWALRKIELNVNNKIYLGKYDLFNAVVGHANQIGVPSQTLQCTIAQSYDAWCRCFKKLGGKPKLKSIRNKLNSFTFPQGVKIETNRIKLPVVGKVKYYKQTLPEGKIKLGRVVKRASGWYLQLTVDANNLFLVKETDAVVGIDTGFKHLAILSNGTKFENQRSFIQGQKRLAQAQRGKHKKLVAKLHERIKNRRKDYNHKISRKIVEDFSEIFITKDNLCGQFKIFGKSVQDAGISQLRQFIFYKGDSHCRKVVLVDSKFTTMTCSICGSKTGPTGLGELDVRYWECSVCGTQHDRDINAAKVVLNTGLGWSLDNVKTHAPQGPGNFKLESSGGAR